MGLTTSEAKPQAINDAGLPWKYRTLNLAPQNEVPNLESDQVFDASNFDIHPANEFLPPSGVDRADITAQ